MISMEGLFEYRFGHLFAKRVFINTFTILIMNFP